MNDIFRFYLEFQRDGERIGASEKLALLAIASRAQGDLPAAPISERDLTAVASIGVERARAVLRSLRRKGVVETYQRMDPNGGDIPSVYWLVDYGRAHGCEPPAKLSDLPENLRA